MAEVKASGMPTELFPLDAPFSLFPWAEQLGPRSDCEEVLRRASALRDPVRLRAELDGRAKEVGLDRKNSRVYFEAVELLELLETEGIGSRRSLARSIHERHGA